MKYSLFSIILIILASCQKATDVEDTESNIPFSSEIIDLSINITSEYFKYNTLNQLINVDKEWSVEDLVSVTVLGDVNNCNLKFTGVVTEQNQAIAGEIHTWDTPSSLFAIYPYEDEPYAIEDDLVILNYDQPIIDVETNANNSVFVAKEPDLKITSSKNAVMNMLELKQVMSVLYLSVEGVPIGEKIESVEFSTNENVFIEQAKVDTETGEIVSALKKRHNIISNICNHAAGADLSIGIAMFPADLRGVSLNITIYTSDDYGNKCYVLEKQIDFNMQRNTISGFDNPMNLSNDFVATEVSHAYLADFEYSVPFEDTWIIEDKEATTNDFLFLRSKLILLQDRKINLIFPYLKNVPEDALVKKIYNMVTVEYIYPKINSISFPSAETIGESALQGCKCLSKIDLPSAISIGDFAFEECENLSDISAPNVAEIGRWAFGNCLKLSTISFQNAKTICELAFANNHNITNVVLPEINTIGESVFAGCDISSLSLPKVTSISAGAFKNCHNLTSINLPNLKIILGDDEDSDNGAFFGCENITSIELPAIENVGFQAFAQCESLEEVNCPNMIYIGEEAFAKCINLKVVSLPNVKSINESSFSGCIALQKISFPNATSIGPNAFRCCSSLTEVELPNMKYIPAGAFTFCTQLSEIASQTITNIGYNAFGYCSKLSKISFPLAETVSASAFHDCTNLIDVYLPKITILNNGLFSNCENLKEISLPNVDNICSDAFNDCTNLTTITIPNAKNIGYAAFSGCRSLEIVNLPSVEIVEGYAFHKCVNLSDINIPSCSSIEDRVFDECIKIQNIDIATSQGVQINIFGGDIFHDTSNQNENITLTIGAINNKYVSGNQLTAVSETGDYVYYKFKQIILKDN